MNSKVDTPTSVSAPIKTGLYIDGQWQSSDQTFASYNPATGELLETLACAQVADALRAAQRADAAAPLLAAATVDQRGLWLQNWAAQIRAHAEPLAQLMTREQGKPLAEARGEVAAAANYVVWYAEQAKRIVGHSVASHDANLEMFVEKIPVGVGLAITPWNFPVSMVTRKLAPALAAGCPVILKPAEDTPLLANAVIELAHRAGFPAGTIACLPCSRQATAAVVKSLTDSVQVKKISFTGSVAVGQQLFSQAAGQLQHISLELGGNAPSIIFDDADLPAAVAAVMATKFRNAGQVCIATNRILVQSGVAEQFTGLLQVAIEAMVVGDGNEPETTLGPVINARAQARLGELVVRATAEGARLRCGGGQLEGAGHFMQPTLFDQVRADNCLFTGEIFGPIAAVTEFDTEQQAIELANATSAGLAAYFYSEGRERCRRVSAALQVGMIGENCASMTNERVPFGGLKHSGMGREGGVEGIEEWLQTRFVCRGYSPQ